MYTKLIINYNIFKNVSIAVVAVVGVGIYMYILTRNVFLLRW